MALTLQITTVPLEIFRVILIEAMHARRLVRALRLRLVNRLFAAEVLRILVETRFLEDQELSINDLGSVGPDFMVHRLLHTRLPVCSRWAEIPRIARCLAAEDDGVEDHFLRYVDILCRRAASANRVARIKNLCIHKHQKGDNSKNWFEYDLISAAAYTNKLSIIDDLGNSKENLSIKLGTFSSPYMNAILDNNHAAIDVLLRKCLQHGISLRNTCDFFLSNVSTRGELPMVLKFLPRWSEHAFNHPQRQALRKLEEMMKTPSVEIFDMLKQIKETTSSPDMKKSLLMNLLESACLYGWEEMVKHLISLGAKVNASRVTITRQPLVIACRQGFVDIIRFLLVHGALLSNLALEKAAESRHWDVVWMLIDEYGADPNGGDIPPIVWAVKQERKDTFGRLLARGVKVDGDTGIMAAEAAQRDGLESMLELLRANGTNIADSVGATKKD